MPPLKRWKNALPPPQPICTAHLAYLQNRATKNDMNARYEVKCRLVRLLHGHKWERTLIREFFLVIDWMMELPPELALQLSHYITALEKEREMEYVSSIERIKLEQKLHEGINLGVEQGLQAGEADMLCRLLMRRFGDLPQWAQERVKSAAKTQIEAWFDHAIDANTLDEVFQDMPH